MGLVAVGVDIPTEMIVWARERSGIDHDELVRRFPKLEAWEIGEASPTLKQLERFARSTHTPVGFFFLPEPPVETVPIPDFRTMGGAAINRPSPDLLDTLYQCQQRQEWLRDYAQVNRLDPVPFVGSFTLETPTKAAAAAIREILHFGLEQRGSSWAEAFRRLAEEAEEAGVFVMVSGVVGSNTHRKLDSKEFRGFALVDSLAPVIFVNGTDTKAAQIFTLAHELAHIWLGESGLDDVDLSLAATNATEQWCNHVTAELLVPLEDLHRRFSEEGDLTDELDRLASVFRVSTLVVLRRVYEADYFAWKEYRTAYEAELARVLAMVEERTGEGGNFYHTQPVRVSKRFAQRVIASTLEGQTLYSDAFQMLGFKKLSTFHELGHHLGVI